MDPAIIEAHTGMKALTTEEYNALNSELEDTRNKIRELNSQVQQKYSAILKAQMDLQNMKKEIEDLKKFTTAN